MQDENKLNNRKEGGNGIRENQCLTATEKWGFGFVGGNLVFRSDCNAHTLFRNLPKRSLTY
jgi:hypothetical protein